LIFLGMPVLAHGLDLGVPLLEVRLERDKFHVAHVAALAVLAVSPLDAV
jgi:hypothetical protein